MASLDSATRRILGEVSDYLQDIEGRSHTPVSEEVVSALRAVEEGIRHSTLPEELSPGQRDVADASGGVLEQVMISDEQPLSPGEQEVAELGSVSN